MIGKCKHCKQPLTPMIVLDSWGNQITVCYHCGEEIESHHIETNKSKPISNLMPHYTNHYFSKARVVFGQDIKCDDGAYSDRLWQWDHKKADTVSKKMKGSRLDSNTAAYWEKWLSLYYDRPVVIIKIYAGFNVSNGYPYNYFGWNWVDK